VSKFDKFFSATKPQPKKQTVKGTPVVEKKTLAKRDDPEYSQALAYIRKDTKRRVKAALAKEDREFSELVEELLTGWLNS
jgi:hypothetical protein